MTLRYTYGNHDILGLYAILLAFAPLPLYLMSRGWSHVVLAASAALWALVLVLPGESTWSPRGAFSEPSWQLLFYGAMVVGYHAHRLPVLTPRAHARLLAVLVPLSAITFAASWIHIDARTPLERHLFSRVEVGPGRLVVAVVWLFTSYQLVTRYRPVVARTAGRIFEPLGRASLYVFIVQAFVTSRSTPTGARASSPRRSPTSWSSPASGSWSATACCSRSSRADGAATRYFWNRSDRHAHGNFWSIQSKGHVSNDHRIAAGSDFEVVMGRNVPRRWIEKSHSTIDGSRLSPSLNARPNADPAAVRANLLDDANELRVALGIVDARPRGTRADRQRRERTDQAGYDRRATAEFRSPRHPRWRPEQRRSPHRRTATT